MKLKFHNELYEGVLRNYINCPSCKYKRTRIDFDGDLKKKVLSMPIVDIQCLECGAVFRHIYTLDDRWAFRPGECTQVLKELITVFDIGEWVWVLKEAKYE